MLTTLRIKNLALVADLTIEFTPGFNVITGETGAGKSVILGAIHLLVGQRAERTLIRGGADQCTVEAVFDVRDLQAPLPRFLEENGLDAGENGELRIRRSFTTQGTNRQFINGSPTTVATLARLGEWLVDMHGPHEHQSLLQPAKQLAILDAFGGLESARQTWETLWDERRKLLDERSIITHDLPSLGPKIELLTHQVQEIQDARLVPEEEFEVSQEYQRIGNAGRLMEISQSINECLSEGDDSFLDRFGQLGRFLAELAKQDPFAHSFAGIHAAIGELIRELQVEVSRYADRLETNPERLLELEQRMNLIQGLKRKYGATVAHVLAFEESARATLGELESREARARELDSRLDGNQADLADAGARLTAGRCHVIARLGEAVARELASLGFRQSRFEVEIRTSEIPGSSGFDSCDFQFAPNPGEPPRALRAIASSGELARVMLALKTVLAAEDQVPLLIFDEVDANVGGETAGSVGRKLRAVARKHQVLCITHLAPVAAHGESHYLVEKHVDAGRTESRIERLDARRRLDEIARMLGGRSDAALGHARELLEKSLEV